ncbi:hypothetical protein GOBAR_AA16056 [Gossypium barbadense]|uniref:Retrotransposon gag domain-containing protein n=1 Tax=Gossypium barbadense TaxID=3634 RepID=A0A2P5XMN0_GOSBA|nr:hypothetical protein GOBAR_AA16056 [Gossypium barbadense]
MGDEETLVAKLEAFMAQMATRQQALEEKMAVLSPLVQKTTKGYSEKNSEEQGSSEGRKRNSDSQQGGCMVPRYSKMEFPSYDGVGDPLRWLKRCKYFFNNQRTNEEDKIGLASFHVLGEAQLWFDQTEEDEANLNWGRFKECCHEHQIDIEMQQSENLGVAMNMARTLERKQNVSSKLSSRAILNWPTSQNTGNNSIISSTKSIAKEGGQTTEPIGNNGKIGSSTPFIKRLTWAEMVERRAKGLCYNCDESYSMGHKCKRLFWIEIPDVEGKQDEDKIDDSG